MQLRFCCILQKYLQITNAETNVQYIALKKAHKVYESKKKKKKNPQLVHALQSMWHNQAQCSVFGPCQTSVTVNGPNEASVVVTLHLGPVGDPILFLWLHRLKSQTELVALSLANPHPPVLWH